MWVLVIEIMLFALAYSDIKSKEIDIRYILIPVIIMVLIGVKVSPFGLIPGLILLILSKLTPDKIGDGDGYVFMAIGIFSGFMNCMIILYMAAVFCLIYGKIKVKVLPNDAMESLPFVPFVLISFSEFIIFR
ncbi:MAG: hypothetical protein Q4E51_00110 [Lachnospiraceae bacterium]|nr:hypothetical protein [Lachnospiraceae bacterium]